jgi:hypothetical protein
MPVRHMIVTVQLFNKTLNSYLNVLYSVLGASSTGSTAYCRPWPSAPTASRPDQIGSGFTYKCDLPVHLPVGSDCLSEAVLYVSELICFTR